MPSYVVSNTTDHSVVIDGLGVLEPSESREFTSEDAARFTELTGLVLLQTNVPQGVECIVKTEGGK